MTQNLLTQAFVAGEISPRFYSRTDLGKYDIGVAEAYNFYVDYRGGLSKAPGTQFMNFVEGPTKSFPFKTDVTNTANFQIIFGVGYIRFTQEGRYILEDSFDFTVASTSTLDAVGHDFVAGDWVYVAPATGTAFVAEIITADTDVFSFEIPTLATPTSFSGAGTVARLLTLTTPYTESDLPTLNLSQHLSRCELTHINHPPHTLEFDGEDWTFVPTPFGTQVVAPTTVELAIRMETGQADAKAESAVGVTVTAIDASGEESLPAPLGLLVDVFNITTDRGSLNISWSPVPGAVRYNLYRTLFSSANSLSKAQQLGYLGSTRGVNFVDPNIVIDFSRTPPRGFNPFAGGAIAAIDILTPGEDYAATTGLTVADGTGFVGQIVTLTAASSDAGTPLYPAGAITSVEIFNGGSGYSLTSAITLTSVGSGTGATLEVTDVTPATGNNPVTSCMFQQRRVYAGTQNAPMTLWGSRPNQLRNFDFSDVQNQGDSYNITLDSSELTPIQHLLPLRDGLLIFHNEGVDRLKASEGVAVTNETASIENQAQIGIGVAPPILVNNDVVYAQRHGTSIQGLSYTFYTNSFAPQDLSVLSSHLLGPGRATVKLVWAEEPARLIWVLREDGVLLACTYQKDQDVVAWTQRQTRGLFRDIVVVEELDGSSVYVTVERIINKVRCFFQERLVETQSESADTSWFVDAGDQVNGVKPNFSLQFAVDGAGYAITTNADFFNSGHIGQIVRFAEAELEITAIQSAVRATVQVRQFPLGQQKLTGLWEHTPAGKWSITTQFTSVEGLYHLEGESVSVLGDGDVEPLKTVVNGSVTLGSPRSLALIGLGYPCRLKTLPIVDPEERMAGRKKRIVTVAVRTFRSRGVRIGTASGKTYEVKESVPLFWDRARELVSGITSANVPGKWEQDAQVVIEQDLPLPLTVLGLVHEVQV